MFRICAPRSSSWSGPNGICLGTPILPLSSKVPSNVYNELFGCSERKDPCSEVTSCGDVRFDVCGEACLIFKFVSLRSIRKHVRQQMKSHSPVEIGCFDIAKSFWFARTEKNHICRNKVVTFHPDHVAHHDIFPLRLGKCSVGLKHLGSSRVEFCV